jgi:glycosyltransferase involved in cell wall biosynthesis
VSSQTGGIRSLAIVTPFYPPHVGGIERYAQEFGRAAAAEGLQVRIITTAPVSRPTETIEDDGSLSVLRLPAKNVPVMGSSYPIATVGWKRAKALLECDSVIAHTRFFMTSLVAATLCARRGKRIYVQDHGAGPLRSSPRVLASASLIYEHAATSALKRLRPKFLAVSSASAQWLHRFGIYDAAIVPNGVAVPRSMPVRTASTFDDPAIFFAGRLLPEKGIRELVAAVEILAGEGVNARLRIAGDGPLAATLQKLAASSPRLTYLGRITSDQVSQELQRSSIFVNPSNLPEGLPTNLLEAGAAALPVISTANGGSTDLIRDSETGWLISAGEPLEIASRLKEVLANPDEALRRGSQLFRLIERSYTWPSIVRGFLNSENGDAK